jgi:hypothetical protein
VSAESGCPKRSSVPALTGTLARAGGLTIPLWLWRRYQGEELRKPAPKSEYEVDRYFARIKVLCETRDKLDAAWLFDQLLGPMYLTMRAELQAAQSRVWDARDRLLELANRAPESVDAELEEIARLLMDQAPLESEKAD